eukprot:2187569-Rhodomonas_salina.3
MQQLSADREQHSHLIPDSTVRVSDQSLSQNGLRLGPVAMMIIMISSRDLPACASAVMQTA